MRDSKHGRHRKGKRVGRVKSGEWRISVLLSQPEFYVCACRPTKKSDNDRLKTEKLKPEPLRLGDLVNLRREIDIELGDPVDVVRPQLELDFGIGQEDIGMMLQLFGERRDLLDQLQANSKPVGFDCPLEAVSFVLPAIEPGQRVLDLYIVKNGSGCSVRHHFVS